MDFAALRQQFFPVDLPAGVIGRAVDYDTVFEVGAALGIFDPAALGHFQTPPERRAKVEVLARLYIRPGSESVVFYHGAEPVGWFWGYMEYADTFTIDTFGLIPEFRGKGIYQAFTRTLIAYLTAVGYERVTVITHVNNRAMLIANLKVGFNIVSLEIGEQRGAGVWLAYLLHADRRADFEEAFRLPRDV